MEKKCDSFFGAPKSSFSYPLTLSPDNLCLCIKKWEFISVYLVVTLQITTTKEKCPKFKCKNNKNNKQSTSQSNTPSSRAVLINKKLYGRKYATVIIYVCKFV